MNHKFSSDVEWICEQNHNRRKWADEVEEKRTDCRVGPAEPPRKDKSGACRNDRREALRTAMLACAMASGGGAAFIGMGIAMDHGATVLLGAVISLVFLASGVSLERMEGNA